MFVLDGKFVNNRKLEKGDIYILKLPEGNTRPIVYLVVSIEHAEKRFEGNNILLTAQVEAYPWSSVLEKRKEEKPYTVRYLVSKLALQEEENESGYLPVLQG
jgi:hypothetical protein